MNVVIIDYGVGNIKSLLNAFSKYCDVVVSNDKEVILNANAIVLPGVGSFGSAMEGLKKNDLISTLHECHLNKKYFLGICLGMQVMFEESEESPEVNGLSFLDGNVFKLRNKNNYKLPNIGWRNIKGDDHDELLNYIYNSDYLYFCHSYAVDCSNDLDYFSLSYHGHEGFLSSFQKDNLFVCQFHPEKSGERGLTIIKNFVNIVNKG